MLVFSLEFPYFHWLLRLCLFCFSASYTIAMPDFGTLSLHHFKDSLSYFPLKSDFDCLEDILAYQVITCSCNWPVPTWSLTFGLYLGMTPPPPKAILDIRPASLSQFLLLILLQRYITCCDVDSGVTALLHIEKKTQENKLTVFWPWRCSSWAAGWQDSPRCRSSEIPSWPALAVFLKKIINK